jgi:hypothetical protein
MHLDWRMENQVWLINMGSPVVIPVKGRQNVVVNLQSGFIQPINILD